LTKPTFVLPVTLEADRSGQVQRPTGAWLPWDLPGNKQAL